LTLFAAALSTYVGRLYSQENIIQSMNRDSQTCHLASADRAKKKFDVSGYIGQKIRVGRQKNFFPNFFYCTDSGQNKHVRSLMHTTAVNQCNFFFKNGQTMIKFLGSAVKI
jgi:hypothetical protein